MTEAAATPVNDIAHDNRLLEEKARQLVGVLGDSDVSLAKCCLVWRGCGSRPSGDCWDEFGDSAPGGLCGAC